MRLTNVVDVVFRQGHLSEQALIEAVAEGNRPPHLDRCEICAERADAIGRWMDEVQHDGLESADSVFTPEHLAAQQSQILRRLEQLDNPARVIAFPAAGRADRDSGGRRVAASWVGIAAAAGLVIGVVGGQLSARLNQPAALPVQNLEAAATPVDGTFLDQSYDQIDISAFEAVDEMTPRLAQIAARNRR